MMGEVAFQGFKPELLEFLSGLRANNNRAWFEAHRGDYETHLLEPAREFVSAMGECLKTLGSDIHAEPRVRGSIFAINHDTRFSRDKTPYKTYLDLWFWQGNGLSRERPGYFFRLTPESLTLGAGMHAFSDATLHRYRNAVLDPVQGEKLTAVGEQLNGQGVQVAGQAYKKVPNGLPADHPRAEWLRYGALFAAIEQPVPKEIFSDQLPRVCERQFQRVAPLQQWLVDQLAN